MLDKPRRTVCTYLTMCWWLVLQEEKGEEETHQEDLRKQLEEVQKQAEAYKQQLKKKEEEAENYKKKLNEMAKVDDS